MFIYIIYYIYYIFDFIEILTKNNNKQINLNRVTHVSCPINQTKTITCENSLDTAHMKTFTSVK